MEIKSKLIKNINYYYLEHSFRDKANKIIKKEKYLGKEIPSNIEKIKKLFMQELNQEIWYNSLDSIKKNFSKEFSKLPLTAKNKYIENFLINFTYNTNRIEGSTITLKETTRLLQDGLTPSNKPIKDIKEVESHKKLFDEMRNEKGDLSLNLIKKWHKILLNTIDDEIAGKIREHNVAIAGSKFEPPCSDELQYLLRKFIQWYKNSKDKLHPVELAALVHLKFVTIHPFTDGNGRISRMLMNFILHRNNYPLLDISYIGRNNYYNALEKSQTKNDDRAFVMHVIKRYLKDYKKYRD